MKPNNDTGNITGQTVFLLVTEDALKIEAFKAVFGDSCRICGGAAEGLSAVTEGTAAVIVDVDTDYGYGLLRDLKNDRRIAFTVIVAATAAGEDSLLRAFDSGADEVIMLPSTPGVIKRRICRLTTHSSRFLSGKEKCSFPQIPSDSELDEKTGIFNRESFCRRTADILAVNPGKDYVICRFDIDRFKIFNNIYGVGTGDRLLSDIGSACREKLICNAVTCGRWESDHFVFCAEAEDFDAAAVASKLDGFLSGLHYGFRLFPRMGVYRVDGGCADVSLMCDRALLALRSVKHNYVKMYAYYDEAMLNELFEEQELTADLSAALEKGQFVIYLQPQYNYAEKKLSGAEVLVRWLHPQKGLILPGSFIPVFERNGFISRMDEYIWEQACILLRKWLDKGLKIVPLSVNISRVDTYDPGLCGLLCGLIDKYGLDTSMLRLEITESAFTEYPERLNGIVGELRAAGFRVELDDFGSGYSSLNTLKDLETDALKLDMKFVQTGRDDVRGGHILSSVVHMANGINLTSIAEGVEDRNQADYLNSLGCIFMQGFYFAKPMPVDAFEAMLQSGDGLNCAVMPPDNGELTDFLDMSAKTASLFNSFAGASLIAEYDGYKVSALRVSDSFIETVGATRDAFTPFTDDITGSMSRDSKNSFLKALAGAAETRENTRCELQWCFSCTGGDCVTEAHIRFLSGNAGRGIYFISFTDITRIKELEATVKEKEDGLRMLTEKSAEVSYTIIEKLCSSLGAGVLIAGADISSEPVYVSENIPEVLGYTHGEFIRLHLDSYRQLIYPEDYPSLVRTERKYAESFSVSYSTEFRCVRKNGEVFWVLEKAFHIPDYNGQSVYVSIFVDIDGEKRREQELSRLHETEQLLRIVAHQTNVHIAFYDFVSDTMNLYGVDSDETDSFIYEYGGVRVRDIIRRVDGESADKAREAYTGLRGGNPEGSVRFRMRTLNGWKWYDCRYNTVFGETNREPLYSIMSIDDITEQHNRELTLLDRATRDEVTGVLNRATFTERVTERLRNSSGELLDVFVIMDIDRFKDINDTFGHIRGDVVLRNAARAAASALFCDDLSGRLGGDEFCFYISGLRDMELVREKVEALRTAVCRDNSVSAEVTCSLGVALYPQNGITFEELYARADKALYRAKAEGRNRAVYYSEELDSQ